MSGTVNNRMIKSRIINDRTAKESCCNHRDTITLTLKGTYLEIGFGNIVNFGNVPLIDPSMKLHKVFLYGSQLQAHFIHGNFVICCKVILM